MAFELVYTSVPRGIKPGSSGFCTVAYTNGLAANVALQLEGMSAYKPYFPHYDENAKLNPVSFSHYLFSSSGKDFHILSRACFYGQDYTKRSNKLAHHVVIEKHDIAQLVCGPAAISLQNDFFRCEWSGEPQLFQQQKQISKSADTFKKAETWAAYTGDAGWAGTLAQHFLDAPTKPVFVIFDPLKHKDTLALVQEAIQLLPPEKRWQVSYNTYFTMLPAGITCCWRFCVPDADVLREARRTPGTLVIDLTHSLPQADAGKLQDAARTGVVPFEQKKAESAIQTHLAENEPPSSLGKQQRRAPQQKRQDIRQGNQLPMKTKQATKSPVLPIVIVSALVLIGGIGWGVYFYTQQKAEEKRILAEREARRKAEQEKKEAEIAEIRREKEEKAKRIAQEKADAEKAAEDARIAQEKADAEKAAEDARIAQEKADAEKKAELTRIAQKEKKAEEERAVQEKKNADKLAQQKNDLIR